MNHRVNARQVKSNPTGGTISTDGRPLPKTGYYVGGAGPLLVFPAADRITGLIADYFRWTQSPYAGWWTDSETGKVYVDECTHLEHREAALALAASRGELAIWDVANAAEIRVK